MRKRGKEGEGAKRRRRRQRGGEGGKEKQEEEEEGTREEEEGAGEMKPKSMIRQKKMTTKARKESMT